MHQPGKLFMGKLDLIEAFEWNGEQIIDFFREVEAKPQIYGVAGLSNSILLVHHICEYA